MQHNRLLNDPLGGDSESITTCTDPLRQLPCVVYKTKAESQFSQSFFDNSLRSSASREISAMNQKFLALIFLFVLFVLISPSSQSKKVVIHVPYKVKNVKHTHTIYKIIPHHEKEEKHEHEAENDHESYDFFRR